MDSPTSFSEKSGNEFLFVGISWLVSFAVCIYVKYFIHLDDRHHMKMNSSQRGYFMKNLFKI